MIRRVGQLRGRGGFVSRGGWWIDQGAGAGGGGWSKCGVGR